MAFVNDTFTDTAGVSITAHTGELGASPWTRHTSYATADMRISDANRLRGNNAVASCFWASGAPSTADYDVEADFKYFTGVAAEQASIAGRINTAANTMYLVRYRFDITSWELVKIVSGTSTTLGTYAQTLASNGGLLSDGVYHAKLQMRGTTIKAFIEGVERISAVDSAISAAGKPGVRWNESTVQTNTTGIHIDAFVATDAVLAPVNTSAPVVSGTRVVGQTLTTTDGTWTNTPTSFAYQWQQDGVNIPGATTNTYLLTAGDAGHLVGCTVVATNAGGSSSPAVSNTLAVVAEIVAADVKFVLSAAAGLGGSPGGVFAPTDVFDAVTFAEAQSGDTEYRAIYLKNTHAVRALNSTVVWINSQTTSPTTDLAIATALEPAGTDVTSIPDESTPPAGITFTAPTNIGSGISIGNLNPGQSRGIWLRRTVVNGTLPLTADASQLAWDGAPA